jgi:hypothetical protein
VRLALGLLASVAVFAAGGAGGWLLAREMLDPETATVTTAVTRTETRTETTTASSLPEAVEETRAALLAAADARNYDALRPFLSPGFRYTFGGPVDGGPVAYWQELERTTSERPLVALAAILRMPYVLSRGIYVWPFAYTVESAADLSDHERELLTALGELDSLFAPGTGYLGWRAGIEPDGTWVFFVAGD